MASTKEQGARAASGEKGTLAVVLTPEQHAARELKAELEQMKADGIQLDRTIPGGFFLGEDGEPHDANGNKIEGYSADKPPAGVGRAKGWKPEGKAPKAASVSAESLAEKEARLRELREEAARIERELPVERTVVETQAVEAAAEARRAAVAESERTTKKPASTRRRAAAKSTSRK